MTKKSQIEILDEETVKGVLFRVITMKNGACDRSLPCRVMLTEDGFKISFYGPHDTRGAERDYKPLTAIPVDMAPLVAAAMEKAQQIQNEWLENIRF